MMHNLTPLYLSSLIPRSVSNLSRYNLCKANDLQTIDARTQQYYQLFLQGLEYFIFRVQKSDSVDSFKRYLAKDKTSVPYHFCIGSRRSQILHTRLQTKCSSLNLDLSLKNISELPLCRSCSTEYAQHFFSYCRYYEAQRD